MKHNSLLAFGGCRDSTRSTGRAGNVCRFELRVLFYTHEGDIHQFLLGISQLPHF